MLIAWFIGGHGAIWSSDFGVTGLIDTPSARMMSDANLKISSAIQSRSNSYAITYQVTPWFEGSFRYTGSNEFHHYDRNFETKFRIIKENDRLPEVAIGIRDIIGTGHWGSEYVVASKKIGNVDLNLGFGWGRLSGKGNFDNPLAKISNRFLDRRDDIGLGGKVLSRSFFSGEKVGLFGGFSYAPNTSPLSFVLEYNPDQYLWENSLGGRSPKSSLSASIKWDISPNLSAAVSRQHQQDWGLAIDLKVDTKKTPKIQRRPPIASSLVLAEKKLPSGYSKENWYQMLLYDVERSGLLMLGGSLVKGETEARIIIGNTGYQVWIDAIRAMIELADIHLPKTVDVFTFVIEEEGYRLHSVRVPRPSKNKSLNPFLAEQRIKIYDTGPKEISQYETSFVTNKLILDVNLANRVQLFDPTDPARYQIYAKIGLAYVLPNSWTFRGVYGKNIINNFDEIKRSSDSVLPKVRTNIVRYLTEGQSGLDALYFEKRNDFQKNFLIRGYIGILESMYSGLGGELLYQGNDSRYALGLSVNYLWQRDFNKGFKHRDYQTTTGFMSAYWSSNFYNLDFAVHVGKYLAKDVGMTLEARRTFNNGWMVGMWATKTNVSSQDFGEGSFDKGLFFKVPFGTNKARTRSAYVTRLRPIQRDGGQRLEDFSGNIWWDLRSARYDALSNLKYRIFE